MRLAAPLLNTVDGFAYYADRQRFRQCFRQSPGTITPASSIIYPHGPAKSFKVFMKFLAVILPRPARAAEEQSILPTTIAPLPPTAIERSPTRRAQPQDLRAAIGRLYFLRAWLGAPEIPFDSPTPPPT